MINDGNGACFGRFFSYLSIVLFSFMGFGILFARAGEQVIKVGVYENAPKIFISESGRPAGIFIDLIEYIAKQEGWNLQYVTGTWAEGLERLEKGEIDLMPDVAYTVDREKIFAFHKVPVLSSWFQVYARKGSGIKSILDLGGKRIAVLERSVQQEAFVRLAESFDVNITIISLPDYQTIFEKVAGNDVDAAISNRFFGQMHANKYKLEDTGVVFNPSDLFFAACKDHSHKKLLNAIDAHLVNLKEDSNSIYYRSLKRWISDEVKFKFPAWAKVTGFAVGVIFFISIFGSMILKHRINMRTMELRASEQKYRELVMLANSIILRWSCDGHITFLNDFGQKFFGYSEAEILGRHVIGTIVPENESTGRDLRPLMEEILADPQKFERNINENIRRNGERVWIDWTNKVVLDKEGQIKEVLSIGSDITDRKRAEEQISILNDKLRQHAEVLEQSVADRTAELVIAKERAESADRIKSAFLATMSHELRTPLNSIIGFTGIMLQELAGPVNEEQHKQLNMVQSSSRHLLSLINDVLDISKIEAGQLKLSVSTFELRPSIEKMIKLVLPLAEKKELDLRLDIADDISTATTDQRRLEQVILNLLNNAVKFTENGYVGISCRIEKDQYLISVSDTGTGMRPEELPGLFQPFHQIDTGLTRKYDGTGLGLSICKKLLDMMGGTIDVQSQWGKGSTFTVHFPVKTGDICHERNAVDN